MEDFNSQFLAKSLESRTACKTADKVLSDLQADLDELNTLEIPTSSAYASQLADIVKLYEYQIGRVTALTEAWALDVTFETPSEHKDEILSTYSSGARSSEGSYLDLYDELYRRRNPALRVFPGQALHLPCVARLFQKKFENTLAKMVKHA